MIAVLGAGGYVGSGVCAEVAAAGAGARFRLVGHQTPVLPVPGAEVVRTDLTSPGAVREAVQGCEVVIDLVSDIRGPQGWRGGEGAGPGQADVAVVRELVASPSPAPALVYASTAALSAPAPGRARPAGPAGPAGSAYVAHKGLAEELVLGAVASGRVGAGCCLRFPSLYGVTGGRRSPARGAVAAMVRDGVERGHLSIWGPGDNLRNWLHVQDAARAALAAADALPRLSGRAWDVGPPGPEPLREMVLRVARACERATGRRPVVEHRAPPEHADPHDLADAAGDPGPFTAATGWTPSWEPTAGVAEMVDRYLESSEAEETG